MTASLFLGFPPVIIFGLLTYMILRSKRVSYIDVFVFVLFGFYLGSTKLAPAINAIVHTIPKLWGG